MQAPDDDPQAVGAEVAAGRLQQAPPLAPPYLALAPGEADRLPQPQLLQLVGFLWQFGTGGIRVYALVCNVSLLSLPTISPSRSSVIQS